jgi:hypothetical protein
MDSNNISIVTIKGTRDVERFAIDFSHEQCLWIGPIVWILLYDIASAHNMFDVRMGNFSQTHALLGVLGDEIPILVHSLAQIRDVEVRHFLDCRGYETGERLIALLQAAASRS